MPDQPDPTTAAIVSTTAELTELRALRDNLRQVVHDLPFGYYDGKVRTHRATKDADIIAWIKRLEALAGYDRDVSLPRPVRREDENHG